MQSQDTWQSVADALPTSCNEWYTRFPQYASAKCQCLRVQLVRRSYELHLTLKRNCPEPFLMARYSLSLSQAGYLSGTFGNFARENLCLSCLPICIITAMIIIIIGLFVVSSSFPLLCFLCVVLYSILPCCNWPDSLLCRYIDSTELRRTIVSGNTAFVLCLSFM